MSVELTKPAKPECYCSFCGKRSDDVLVLVAGVTCFICDECVDLCVNIVAEHRAKNPPPIGHPALLVEWATR